jgi:CobQ-like glutamine amidotransferase family enzyme
MIIEVLFDEICNLYGDPQNAKYLSLTLPDSQIVRTSLDSEPYFANSRPDIILIGSMSDSMQEAVITKMNTYKSRIVDLINDNVVFLATGNACEVFCNSIENLTLETRLAGLSIFPYDVKINWFDRYNGKVLGRFEDTVKNAADKYEPSLVTRYALDLATAFNKFYISCKIAVEDENVKNFRLSIAKAVKTTLTNALTLLGIETVEQM